MRTNSLQAELPLGPKKREPVPLDLQVLYTKTTFLGALKYVIQCGNFEYEKELYKALGIDAGNWTRVMNGSASFPQEKEEVLQEICGNDGLVRWRAYRAGKGIYDLQEAKDKEIAALKTERDQLKAEIETLTKYGVIGRVK